MRSCDIHNLQFESEYNEDLRQYLVKPDTIRLVCPYCKFEHTEDMKRDMNINGGYIHKIPSKLTEAPGYLTGIGLRFSANQREAPGRCPGVKHCLAAM